LLIFENPLFLLKTGCKIISGNPYCQDSSAVTAYTGGLRQEKQFLAARFRYQDEITEHSVASSINLPRSRTDFSMNR
jgi:hypothetical protein